MTGLKCRMHDGGQYRCIGHRVEMASDGVRRTQSLQRRPNLIADGPDFVWAACRKCTAGMRCGNHPATSRFSCGVVIGSRGEQHQSIGVIWRLQYLAGGADLADLASIHDCNTIGELGYDRKIVRDEQVGEAESITQVSQQIDDCRLHRHIECGDRLVADDKTGLGGECPSDRHALSLSAAELMRKTLPVGTG